jgi:Fe-S-cluster-containing dehydrogenase component
MNVSRRGFLKLAGAVGAAGAIGLAPKKAEAAPIQSSADKMSAMLIDTTRCVGCRACEAACSEANRLPEPAQLGQESVFERKRTTDARTYTVVNRYNTANREGAPRFVKSQCMHCVTPSCASACLVKALEKTPEGPVVYHKDRCIGCRYCMVACPFDVPKFEYDSALPYIQKCTFCAGRAKEGKLPACASVCPTGALQFGQRKEMLETARTRIYQNPDRYVHHIYGEHEAGGTGFLYISDVPFEQLGFKMNVGNTAYAEFTWPILSAVPFVLMLWPPLLMGIHAFTKSREENDRAGAEAKEAHHE